MKLYEELVATQHPAVAWEIANIQTVLSAINPAITVRPHGNDYLLSGVPAPGLFPGLLWRTGDVMYGYYNGRGRKGDHPTPTGWFFTPQMNLHRHLLERKDASD